MFRSIYCISLFLAATLAADIAAAQKPNVLLIISDDLRDTVGCYGNTAVKTPNIDRLAKLGVCFERAYVQYPVCNPSRASFLTGLRCEQTCVVGNATPFRSRLPDITTLPQMLREQGWHTASYGKVFHAGGSKQNLDAWIDTAKSWDQAMMFSATPKGKVIEGGNLTNGKLKWCEWGAAAGDDSDQPDGQTANSAIATIEEQTKTGKPWFVCAGFHRPHDPFISPKKYFDMYPPGSLKLYRDPADATPLQPLSISGDAFRYSFNAFTDKERNEFLRAYYAGVSFMDAQVGRLMETMDRLKLWENTLVIFTGDNGYHHNERNWWNKNTLFERSCRVPFIVVAPGAKNGRATKSLVELVDLYPTVVDYCQLKPPHKLAGETLRPLLENPDAKGRQAAFTLVTRGRDYGQAVRTDRWRFIQWSDGNRELYDQTEDPQNVKNVAGDPKHAGLILELKDMLKKVGAFDPDKKANSAASGYFPIWQKAPPNITDLVLIYQGGKGRLEWTADQFAPYVSHKTKESEKWLFDGFLFIEFRDGEGHAYGEGGKLAPARKEHWRQLIERNFEPGRAIPALEETCEATARRVGDPIRPRQVVLTLPEPYHAQTNWGELDGRALDFHSQSDRLAAAQWHIDLAIERWNTLKPRHLKLAGFYWVTESTGGPNAELLPQVSKLVHSRGLSFFWIPYWRAANAARWRELGFDAAYQQPNHFFHSNIPDSRLNESCAFARKHGLGMEFEMDGRAMSDRAVFGPRFDAYLDAFTRHNAKSQSAVAYYEGGGALLSMAKSSDEADKKRYDTLAGWVLDRQEAANNKTVNP